MIILITNDDGIDSPGIKSLTSYFKGLGELWVVAPDRERNAIGRALTLHRPLRVQKKSVRRFAVNGTPSDCVHIALTGLLDERPDLIVSGINNGQNMGDDTIYSGTVAAAMEGYLFGIPAIAFSLVDKGYAHLDAAAAMAAEVVRRYVEQPLPAPFLLNVNIPNRPAAGIKGIVATRLGKRHPSEPVVRASNPRGEPIYWIGAVGAAREGGPGTDFHATAEGYVSVTPLQIDLTHTGQLDGVRGWLARH